MKKVLCCLTVCAGLAGAQGFEAFQLAGPQVYEYRTGTLVGGTYLGVNLAEIDADRARELKLKEPYGVEITRVEEGSPADKAGIKANDVVLEYNGQRVEGMEQFGRMVRETPPGRDVKLLISRNGATQTIAATTATRKVRTFSGNFKDYFPNVEIPEVHIPDMPQVFTTYRSGMLGVESESLNPQLATYFGVKEGVLIRSVLKDTPAEKAGIGAGDVITKVDGKPVTTSNELAAAIRASRAKKTFPVELMRDHKQMTLNVTIEEARPERVIPRGRVVRNNIN